MTHGFILEKNNATSIALENTFSAFLTRLTNGTGEEHPQEGGGDEDGATAGAEEAHLHPCSFTLI